ncbi:MAG: PTS sugar transporter subunit IIA [Spirochaetaceae bacterium]|nr:MAG: PTS sugar transporter subunit IIA [Spirochaetaceae bacterium]
MALVDLIRPEVVKVPLVSTTKPEVIRELVEVLRDSGKIADVEAVYDALMKRESLGSTGLEQGIAVPHAKTPSVNSLTIALGISPKGIDFQAIDGNPSKLFFLLLAPPDQSGPHIEALADIARITKSQAFCRTVIGATTPAEVVELFSEN